MKKYSAQVFTFALVMMVGFAFSQGGPPPPPPPPPPPSSGVPLDGGIFLLLGSGLMYGYKKWNQAG